MNLKPSQRIRPVYRVIQKSEITELIQLIKLDIAELEKELNGDYPSIVLEAIEDTINRYTFDLGYLERRLNRPQKKQ